MLNIGNKVKNCFDQTPGLIEHIDLVAGLETYFVREGNGDIQAYYNDELEVIQ